MRKTKFLGILLLVCLCRAADQPDSAALARTFSTVHWISYGPTHYYPAEDPPVYPGPDSLTADLRTLRAAGFDGLITYSAELSSLPGIAEAVGFRSLLIGIWDPWSAVERRELLKAVAEHPRLIVGVIVGNEGLESGRYQIDALCDAMAELRRSTAKPVSSTEPIEWVLAERRLAECSGFLTINGHPFYSGHRDPAGAVQWTVEAWNAIRQRYPGKPALMKEVGLPSRNAPGLSEESQKDYYVRLSRTKVVFSYFEAFDADPRFKSPAIEQAWGLWRSDRSAKPIVNALPWRTGK